MPDSGIAAKPGSALEVTPFGSVITKSPRFAGSSRGDTSVRLVETKLGRLHGHCEDDSVLILEQSNPERHRLGCQERSSLGRGEGYKAYPCEVAMEDLVISGPIRTHGLCPELAESNAMAPSASFKSDVGRSGRGDVDTKDGHRQQEGKRARQPSHSKHRKPRHQRPRA